MTLVCFCDYHAAGRDSVFCLGARGGKSSADLFAKWAGEITSQHALGCGAPPVQVYSTTMSDGSDGSELSLALLFEVNPRKTSSCQ